jgi:hypothetical protein
MNEEDNILIATPWGKKRWGLIRKALELYEKTEGEEYEDPNDYSGMGWVGQDGRP